MPRSDTTEPAWRVNAPGSRGRDPVWRVLWRSRELVVILAARDVRVRYRQAVLGVLWVLLQPVTTVVVFTLVFDRLADVGTQGVPYPLFALLGMVLWIYVSSAITRGSEVLVANPALVTKVYFPRITAPFAALLPPLVDLAVALVLLAGACVYYGQAPGWALLAAPAALLMVMVTAAGVTLWLSALNVRYRDVQHAVGPLLQVWLFASPVAYSGARLQGWQDAAYSLNPLAGALSLARWSVLGAPWPGAALLVSVGSAAVLLGSGLAYFRAVERYFADVI